MKGNKEKVKFTQNMISFKQSYNNEVCFPVIGFLMLTISVLDLKLPSYVFSSKEFEAYWLQAPCRPTPLKYRTECS